VVGSGVPGCPLTRGDADLDQAVAYFRTAVQGDPDNPNYKIALATSAPDLSGPNVCGLNAALIEGVRIMIGV